MDTNVEKSTTLNNIEGKVVSIPLVDRTLTKPGKSADAKVVGDEIARLDGRVDNIDPHFAKNVQYDNTKSKLNATDMQGAVDEMHADLYSSFFETKDKPTGYYTGNGNATLREIAVGGVGGVVIIYSNNAGNLNICLVTKIGAVSFSVGGASKETKYMSSAVFYRDGKLSLATADSSVNSNNVNYYYQVL